MEELKGKKVYIRTIRGEYVYRRVVDVVGTGKGRKLILDKYNEASKERKIRERDIEWIKVF